MRIFVETKRGGELDSDQIWRHLEGIEHLGGTAHSDILIGLTREQIAATDRKQFTTQAATKGIIFVAVTFSQIVENLKAGCETFERELLSIVEDYETYLAEEGLLEKRNQTLVVFPCGTSIAENARFRLYYEPSSRPSKRSYRFIGIYNQKSIAYIGEVSVIALASYEDDGVIFTAEAGHLTEEHEKRIKDAVDSTPYYDLKDDVHRFYLVDRFIPTQVRKTSPGGIMDLRYLDLANLIKGYSARKDYSADELAAALEGATWE